MSRRKQARPRALKLDEEEDENQAHGKDESPSLRKSERHSSPCDEMASGDETPRVAMDTDEDDESRELRRHRRRRHEYETVAAAATSSAGSGEYRCGSCGVVFHSLNQFMDHKNYDCSPNSADKQGWASNSNAPPYSPAPPTPVTPLTPVSPVTPFAGECESPDSLERAGSTGSASTGRDLLPELVPSSGHAPYSPNAASIPVDQLPYSIGANENNPYPCQFCDKAFSRLSYLKRHEQVHNDQLPFKCEYCHRLFKHKRSRDRHVKLHTGDKKYKCPHCDAAFSRSDHLKIHLKTHDNGKPYQCSICNRGYTTAAALTYHMQSHKKGDGVGKDQLKCLQCLQRFPSASELQAHILTHKEALAVALHHAGARSGAPGGPGDEIVKAAALLEQQEKTLQNGITNGRHHGTEAPSIEGRKSRSSSGQAEDLTRPEPLSPHPGVLKPFRCPVCVTPFAAAEEMLRHVQLLHDPQELLKAGAPPPPPPPPHPSVVPSPMQLAAAAERTSSLGSEGDARTPLGALPSPLPPFGNSIAALASKGLNGLNCPVCNKIGFHSLKHIEHHLKTSHSDQPPVQIIPCTFCYQIFGNIFSLNDHMQTYHESAYRALTAASIMRRQLQSPASPGSQSVASVGTPSASTTIGCDLCTMVFSTEEFLLKHKEAVHSFPNPLNTPVSREEKTPTFPNSSFSHFFPLSGGYSCPQCSMTFLSPLQLADHIKFVHADRGSSKFESLDLSGGKIPKSEPSSQRRSPMASPRSSSAADPSSLTCNQCNATFLNFTNFQAHMRTHLQEQAKEMQQLQQQQQQSQRSTRHQNRSCERKDSSPSKLSSSSRSVSRSRTPELSPRSNHHNQPAAQIQSNSVEGELSKTPEPPANSLPFPCSKCDLSFSTEDALDTHMCTHFLATTTEYGCQSCFKLFSKPDELQKHLMDIHAHHLYRCSLCKEMFDSKVTIQVHFAVKHSNECKLYKCTVCPPPSAIFRSEMEWQLHVKVNHLRNAKPYRCLFCQEGFTAEVDFQYHLTTHQKHFKCHLCEETFYVEYQLDQHLATKHTNESNNPSRSDVKPYNNNNNNNQSKAETSSTNGDAAASAAAEQSNASSNASRTSSSTPEALHQSTTPSTSETVTSLLPPPRVSSGLTRTKDDKYKCEICDAIYITENELHDHRARDHKLKVVDATPITSGKKTLANGGATRSGLSSSPVSAFSTPNAMSPLSLMPPASSAPVVHLSQKGGGAAGKSGGSGIVSLYCVYCNQVFKTKSELEKHMKTHIMPTNLKCNICDEVFPNSTVLAEHKLQHCKVLKGNVCVVCKVALKDEEQFFSHVQKHCGVAASQLASRASAAAAAGDANNAVVMQCIVCRQTLTSMIELQLHSRHHFQNGSEPNFMCTVCTKTYTSLSDVVAENMAGGTTVYVCGTCYQGDDASPGEQPLNMCVKTRKRSRSEDPPFANGGVPAKRNDQRNDQKNDENRKISCPICSQKMETEDALSFHARTVHNRTFQCIKCQETFATEYEIKVHVAKHVLQEGVLHECRLCGQEGRLFQVFDSPAKLQTHLIIHTYEQRPSSSSSEGKATVLPPSEFVCTVCNALFTTSDAIQRHAVEHGMAARQFACQSCPQTFFFSAELQNHAIEHEMAAAFQNFQDLRGFGFPAFGAGNAADRRGLFASTPQSPASSGNDAKSSGWTEEGGKESQGGGSIVKEENQSSNLDTFDGRVAGHPITCQLCPSSLFDSYGELARHFATSHSEAEIAELKEINAQTAKTLLGEAPRSYKCPLCHAKFDRREARKEHLKSQHPGLKSYLCPVCGKGFGKKSHVKDHVKVYHAGSTAYECGMCGEPFAHPKFLRRHMLLVHNKTADTFCHLCPESFTLSRNLKRHLRRVHNIETPGGPEESSGSSPSSASSGGHSFESDSETLTVVVDDHQQTVDEPIALSPISVASDDDDEDDDHGVESFDGAANHSADGVAKGAVKEARRSEDEDDDHLMDAFSSPRDEEDETRENRDSGIEKDEAVSPTTSDGKGHDDDSARSTRATRATAKISFVEAGGADSDEEIEGKNFTTSTPINSL